MTNNYSKRNILAGIHLLAGYKEPLCFAESYARPRHWQHDPLLWTNEFQRPRRGRCFQPTGGRRGVDKSIRPFHTEKLRRMLGQSPAAQQLSANPLRTSYRSARPIYEMS